MPPATAAAVPPDEPPGVRPCSHGLWVVPFSTVRVTFTPPNSDAVVWPTRTAPPRSRARPGFVLVTVAISSRKTTQAWVSGHPSTWSSSFTPIGTPPNGFDTSAERAAASACSRCRCENTFNSLASMAAYTAVSSSDGLRSPDRNASTRLHASPCHGPSAVTPAMGGTVVRRGSARPRGRRRHPRRPGDSSPAPPTIAERPGSCALDHRPVVSPP